VTNATTVGRALDANEAVAAVAYRLSEVIAIYPITPASPMGEHADDWAARGVPNLWGQVPTVVEMQSEGGAAGTVHGALQGGALATTFTASQGLLLMLPNLFKIAGELTAFCGHVAARTVATHALSIFGDHSDVMAARTTGVALLASGSPQEAQDLAAVGHVASLAARVPFLHFFDGFRTSHEIQRVRTLDDDTLRALVDDGLVAAHRRRGLSPDRPIVRGTAHNPDTWFQAREAVNPFYDATPDTVEAVMGRLAAATGRRYGCFEYAGHPEAEQVIVVMGSAAECVHEVVEARAAAGAPVGVVKVRLFRPFDLDRFDRALPPTVRRVAVLDRTKEPGAVAEPLALEVTAALVEAAQTGRRPVLPEIVAGRYGLSSKELTPPMVEAVLAELAADRPRRRFTVGVTDDVTHLSLPVSAEPAPEPDDVIRAVFYGLGADGTVSANKATLRIVADATPLEVQGHFVYDSKKAGTTTVSHLRFSPRPIRAPYEIRRATFVGIHDPEALDRRDVLAVAAPGATVLCNTAVPAERFWDSLSREVQERLAELGARLWVVDAYGLAAELGLGRRINTIMQACFFALCPLLSFDEARRRLKAEIAATWGRRGPEIVRRNQAAVDEGPARMTEVPLGPVRATRRRRPAVPDDAPDFVRRVTRLLLEGHGDRLPVSAFPPDGTWPTGTARYEKRRIALEIPVWEPDLCIQCNRCSMICPHACIRTKVFDPADAVDPPPEFRFVSERTTPELAGAGYVVQVSPDDCTGCGLCVEVCPAHDRTRPRRRAVNMVPAADHRDREATAWAYLERLPDLPAERIPREPRRVPLLAPRFEFSGACAGCGETPYLRLLTQLFGDRLVIANATGCSSIYGGNLPTTPYTTGPDGRGPAWSNSLFEDNAEFGLGLRLALDALADRARGLIRQLAPVLGDANLPGALVSHLLAPTGTDPEALTVRRAALDDLRRRLAGLPAIHPPADRLVRELQDLAEHLVPRTVWLVGGDGWAYDIGAGGLDHVLAGTWDVNVLVLDTEVYSNTGGQQSKATPIGAAAKFAVAGKASPKKDLGLEAMTYGHVYVASVALQARSAHTVHALLEAEAYPGPSLVIAHSPCIAHGYDLVHSPTQQMRAIKAGAWPLYRFDPRRIAAGEPPLHVDADPRSIPMREYMEQEARFRMVELRDPDRYRALVAAAERAAQERHDLYAQLARIRLDAHAAPDDPEPAGG
jgi:pyruvate-ferredoxin/flavodoxin oxidoreductase